MSVKQKNGFTLIELLIVVAIIAILAAIAVPNFLEAQVRAKVSRTRNDLRSLAVALEAYYVDWNSYTYMAGGAEQDKPWGWKQLTTPIAYMTTILRDPFGESKRPTMTGIWREPLYELGTGAVGVGSAGDPDGPGPGYPSNTWEMDGRGPDKIDDTVVVGNSSPRNNWSWQEGRYPWPDIPANDPRAVSEALSLMYDPTNGAVSRGNILRLGGMKPPGRVFDLLYGLASRR